MADNSMLDRLNEYQKKAVYDNSKACIVNANVGSGKTTVLISKILYLHNVKNIEYRNMIVLTFTNKAADEIKARLKEQEPELDTQELRNFGTFHSVALHYLRTYLSVDELGFTKDFQVIEPEEELEIAMQLIKEKSLNIKYKNRLKKRLEQEDYDRYQDDILELRHQLQEEKIRQNKMTFSDLLYIAVHLIETCDDPGYTSPDWIIIDEVQDSDNTQLQLIDAFMGKATCLFAVGDPNQIIYSWRGSKSNVFRELIEKYNATELSLPVNYRSSSAILEAAKRFQQTDHNLIGVRDTGSRIVVRNHYDSFQEAGYLVDRIQEIHSAGVPYHEIAIFYRLQNQSEVFEKVFSKNELPYEVSIKKTLHDFPVLDWVCKLLRSAVNRQDRYAREFCLNHKVYGPGKSKAQKAQREKLQEKILHFAGYFGATSDSSMIPEQCMDQVTPEQCHDGIMIDVGKDAISSQKLYDYFALDLCLHPTSASYQEDKQLVLAFFDKMLLNISEHKMNFIDGAIDYVNSSVLYGMEMKQSDNIPKDSVKLMTLHASKGLEFSYVFITGVNYGVIPLRARTFEEEDEERRLFFVGITRAKDHLEMSYYTNPDMPRSVAGPSSFIRTLPRNLVDVGQGKNHSDYSDSMKDGTRNELGVLVADHEMSQASEILSDPNSAKDQSNDLFDDLFSDKPVVDLHELKRQIVTEKRNAAIAFRGIIGNETTTKQFSDTADEKQEKQYAQDEQYEQKEQYEKDELCEQYEGQDNPQMKRQASHEKYGVGTIIKEDDMMITVEFEGYGEKEFIKGFGDLTLL